MQEQFNQALLNLKEIWGYDGFRSGQDKAIQSIFSGNDTLALFPTGGGKSLCYQVPATVFEGLTLVISPLVALMQDQVDQLKKLGVSATFINNTIPFYEVEQRLVNARNGVYKLLYCAPERLATEVFQNELKKLSIDLVAIDEAHCISEWGHDFRPAYRNIKEHLRSIANSTSWIALTATATPEVKKDILKSLEFTNPETIALDFARPNLKWWVIETDKTSEKMISGTQKAIDKGNGLIYGGTRKNCDYWATFYKKGIKTEAYHAGLESEDRKQIQERWINGETPLVVATNAFGMGIDKPDCRFVIHESMPYSLEAYYQEAGRAGRDGEEAFPMLYYKSSDYTKAIKRLEQSYPTKEQLDKVYMAFCDSFNIAVGTEMDEMKKVDLASIQKRSGESLGICRSSLRLLEQFGMIAWQQDVKPAFSIQFTLNRDMLQKFKERSNNPEKAEFVDRLERFLNPNAFHEMVNVDEEEILKTLNISRNGLMKALNVLMQNDCILIFTRLNERDLARVLEARYSKLPFTKQEVEQQRETLFKKLQRMQEYAISDTCREVFLRNYFGDSTSEKCGHCDNCLRTNAKPVLKQETLQNILDIVSESEKSYQYLSDAIGSELETKQALSYLIREGKVEQSKEGMYYYKDSGKT